MSAEAASHLAFAHPLRPEWCLLLAALAVAALWWSYRRGAPGGRARWGFMGVRLAALALIAVALLQPLLRTPQDSNQAGTVLIGIDVSRSMASADGGQTRLAHACAQLAGPDGALARLAAAGAQTRLFAFGAHTREISAAALPTLAADEDGSDLGDAIRAMGDNVRAGTPSAMMLLTDAADTTEASPVAAARRAAGAGSEVHVVALGCSAQAADVALLQVRCPPTVEVGAATPITVAVGRQHYQGEVTLKLFQGDTFLTAATMPAGTASVGEATLTLLPRAAGALDLRVVAEAAPGETTLTNNAQALRVRAEERRVEVLFVEGSPRHEFAFIRRTMSDDRHFRLVTLLRLGHGRWANGSGDGSARGDGFPATAEELARYGAIILSDIEAAEFKSDELALIADFVTKRGGGLLMLGGTNAFNLGGYAATPLAALMPVELASERGAGDFDDRPFTFSVTADGLEHEILRQGRSRAETEAQWKLMPQLKGLNVLLQAKPGATVLGVRSQPEPVSVVLAVQDAGAGRVAAFASANSWRWKMLRALDDDGYRRFWSQMIRWLAVGNRQMLTLEIGHQIAPVGQAVAITARVLDRAHRPSNQAQVAATITDPGGHESRIPLTWILSEDGTYQAEAHPDQIGEYRIRVEATLPGAETIADSVSLLTVSSSRELDRCDADAVAARAIADAGGGAAALDGDARPVVDAILAKLKDRSEPVTVVAEHELADSPLLLLAIAALLIGEWAVRRRRGLA